MDREDVRFENDRGQMLAGLLDGEGDRGVVLCSHFTGFKELAHLHNVARGLADAGFTALRFDYADCIGESEGACEEMEVTHQVRDTLAALDHLERDRGVDSVGLWGHSLGGLTAIAAAAEHGEIGALVSVAAPAKLEWETLFRDRADRWRSEGEITFETWRQGQISLPYGFYRDLKGYDATGLMARVHAPTLAIHLGDDGIVQAKNAEAIHASAAGESELVTVEGSDHLMSGDDHEAGVVEASVDWFERWL